MSKAAMNLQDSFLNQVRRENAEVKILLVNGTVLRGNVKGFDNFTLILNNRNGQHLVYKHAIAQLVSHRPMSPRREGEEHGAPEGELAGGETHSDAEGAVEAPVAAVHADFESRPAEKKVAEQRPHEKRGGEGRSDSRGEGRPDSRGADNRQAEKPSKPKERKEGFNTLDLSNVKISGEARK